MGPDVKELKRRRCARLFGAAFAGGVLLSAPRSIAAVAEPSPHADESFDFMNFISQRGLHNLSDEDWNAYGQITDIWSQKFAFQAKYTNLNGSSNSLLPNQELSFTETATFYLGFRLWPGAEAYIIPEIIAERPLSGLVGLGGVIQNFELQKQGSSIPTPYLSRSYLRQTIGLGGGRVAQSSDPQQLGHVEDRRQIVLIAGNFSVLDFFDKNNVSGDLRRSFFNMSFLTYSAFDFAADARGYAWGGDRGARLRRLDRSASGA